jgi:hypothetical protein
LDGLVLVVLAQQQLSQFVAQLVQPARPPLQLLLMVPILLMDLLIARVVLLLLLLPLPLLCKG